MGLPFVLLRVRFLEASVGVSQNRTEVKKPLSAPFVHVSYRIVDLINPLKANNEATPCDRRESRVKPELSTLTWFHFLAVGHSHCSRKKTNL
ncbi:hypothetical protein J6590_039740 [Homalodisca vitripennis]|nr:hypothetical protein J6590_039740 [Homalodisca vitripennis]